MCDMILPIESANKVCQLNAPLLLSIIYMSHQNLASFTWVIRNHSLVRVTWLMWNLLPKCVNSRVLSVSTHTECVNSHRVCQLTQSLSTHTEFVNSHRVCQLTQSLSTQHPPLSQHHFYASGMTHLHVCDRTHMKPAHELIKTILLRLF